MQPDFKQRVEQLTDLVQLKADSQILTEGFQSLTEELKNSKDADEDGIDPDEQSAFCLIVLVVLVRWV
jgi:hypothetical protein